MAQGESKLGTAQDALKDFRDLILQSGNGSYDQKARDALVQQLESLRNQVLSYANAKDSNGLPIFRGLGSKEDPLVNSTPGANSQLQPGQATGSENGLPLALDGFATDRESTRLNSSHLVISYAVFCLKKKKIKNTDPTT